MAQRIAGIAQLQVDGVIMALRGNFTVSPSSVERTMLAGQDGVHGYQELPRIPYNEGDCSTVQGFYVKSLLTQTNVTVIATLANDMVYKLTGGMCKDAIEINTRDGQFRVRWEGLSCDEYVGAPLPSPGT